MFTFEETSRLRSKYDLKRCPFCGGKADFEGEDWYELYIGCSKCGATGGQNYLSCKPPNYNDLPEGDRKYNWYFLPTYEEYVEDLVKCWNNRTEN